MKTKSVLQITFCVLLATGQVGFCQANKTASHRTTYNIIFDGNSWVAGSGSTGGSNFPNQVVWLLQHAGKIVKFANYGIAGQTIDQMQKGAPAKIDPHHKDCDFLVGLELVNQWGCTAESKELVYKKYKQYFLDRQAAGFQKIIAVTPIPQGYYPRANWETDRKWFVAKMLEEFPKLGIYVADIGADPKLADWNNSTYFSKDRIHPTSAGYAVFARIVYDVILKAE